jgi:hypothetical protein
MQRVFLLYLSFLELVNFGFEKRLKALFFRITSGVGGASVIGFAAHAMFNTPQAGFQKK